MWWWLRSFWDGSRGRQPIPRSAMGAFGLSPSPSPKLPLRTPVPGIFRWRLLSRTLVTSLYPTTGLSSSGTAYHIHEIKQKWVADDHIFLACSQVLVHSVCHDELRFAEVHRSAMTSKKASMFAALLEDDSDGPGVASFRPTSRSGDAGTSVLGLDPSPQSMSCVYVSPRRGADTHRSPPSVGRRRRRRRQRRFPRPFRCYLCC